MFFNYSFEGTVFYGASVVDGVVFIDKNDYLKTASIELDTLMRLVVEEFDIKAAPHHSKEQQYLIYEFVARMVNAELEKTVFSEEWIGSFWVEVENLGLDVNFELTGRVCFCFPDDVEEYFLSDINSGLPGIFPLYN